MVSRDRGDACPGALRLHTSDDGALARIRIPGGILTVRQAEALAGAARRLGDGELHLTSRGNVQLRGLGEGCGAELADLLDAAGLLPSREHERVRNIVASPLSGLDGRGLRDVRAWLQDLDAALCASAAARALSGRFLFALDDGRGDVAGLGADVTVRATADGGALLGLGAAGETLRVSGQDAPRAALVAAEVFLDAVRAGGERAWRMDELPLAKSELIREIRHRLTTEGIAGARQTSAGAVAPGGHCRPTPDGEGGPAPDGHRRPAPDDDGGPAPGFVGDALSVHAPLGRLTGFQWRELMSVADRATSGELGELRLTPWRGIVVPAPGMSAARAAESLARLSAAGLVTDPASPWLRVGACIGRPGCAKSRTDVRADATDALGAVARDSLPLYWSGCERRCGHPRGGRVDVIATVDGGYLLSATSRGQAPRTASMDHPSQLAAALAAITS